RPLIKHLGGVTPEPLPAQEATLTRKIRSEPGIRTFVRVTLETGASGLEATPTRASGSGVLSSVALADGWVVVEESREGIAEGETVAVENWEYNG
ncbi:MAG: molybdopterin molybdotransferase, partial [Natronomonas sp.]